MYELLHILEHVLGLCGEKHPSIIYLLSEWHTFNPVLNYIKRILQWYKTYMSKGVIRRGPE